MVLKLWDIDNGKVTYLKYTNNKNESRIIKLKEPTEPDRIPMSKMEEALELVFGLVSSIKKLDNVEIVNGGKDNNVETKLGEKVEVKPELQMETRPEAQVEDKPEIKVEDKPDVNIKPWVKVSLFSNEHIDPWVKRHVDKEKNVETGQDERVETKPEEKVETKPEEKVEKWAWEEEYDKDNGKEVPKEVSDKLNLLLHDDGGKRDGPQFLINKNKEKGVDTDKNPLSISNSRTNIVIEQKEEIVSKKKPKTPRKKKGSKYERAVIRCAPGILKEVAESNDAKTLIKSSDLAKRMGDEFVGIDSGLLDSNVRYRFFYQNLIMTALSPEETDIYADKGGKVFRFRLRQERDKLPDSVLKQRNKVDT
jgi:hypothetical protein